MRVLKNKFRALAQRGLFHILTANAVNKIIGFLSNILVVRLLTTTEYGIFSVANNVYSIAMIFIGFGSLEGILQYGCEARKEEEKQAYYRYSSMMLVVSSISITLLVFFLGKCNLLPIKEVSPYVCQLAFLLLLYALFQFLETLLRVKKKNKKYAKLLNINSMTYSAFSCIGAYTRGVSGLIWGRYISYTIAILMGLYYLKEDLQIFKQPNKLTQFQKLNFVKFSVLCWASTAINQLFYLLDVSVISFLIPDPIEIASYKIATIIPEGLAFIPQSIIVFMLPYIISHNQEKEWLQKKLKQIFLWSLFFYGVIAAFIGINAPLIIKILWGNNYQGSILPFRILSANFFIMAVFRVNATNILVALRKVKFNFIISLCAGIVNVGLDFLLVHYLGISGAAWATFAAVFAVASASYMYLWQCIKKLNNA